MARPILLLLLTLAGAGCEPPPEAKQDTWTRRIDERHAEVRGNEMGRLSGAWAECRSVCGDQAAMLPYGDLGRVTCACVPACKGWER